MVTFDMELAHNSATFHDSTNLLIINVSSFDNKEFEVSVHDRQFSEKIGVLSAQTSEELNDKISALYHGFLPEFLTREPSASTEVTRLSECTYNPDRPHVDCGSFAIRKEAGKQAVVVDERHLAHETLSEKDDVDV